MKKEYVLGSIGILLVGMLLGSAVAKMSHKGRGAHRVARVESMRDNPQWQCRMAQGAVKAVKADKANKARKSAKSKKN